MSFVSYTLRGRSVGLDTRGFSFEIVISCDNLVICRDNYFFIRRLRCKKTAVKIVEVVIKQDL